LCVTQAVATGPLTGFWTLNDAMMQAFASCSGTPCLTVTLGTGGTVWSAAEGGTGFSSYAVGDLLYADTTTTLAKLVDVTAGSYLRSGGANTAPVWSTTRLPNSAVVGDVLYASATNVYNNLADVAAGAYLRSGGVTTAPLWSTVTLPNSAVVGDLLSVSATNVYANIAAVASGSVLTSGGATTLPAWSATPSVTSMTLTGATGNILVADTNTLLVDATNHWVGIRTTPTMPLTIGDATTQIAAQKELIFLGGVHTLSANNAQTYYGSFGTIDVNQAGFNATASVIGHRIYPRAIGSSGTLTNSIGFITDVTNTGAGTITNGYGFWANGATNSGGGTFSNYTAFYIPANTGASTIYGLRATLASNANRWNIYADGTAQNFFAGSVGIGSGKSAPGVALDIAGMINSTGMIVTPQTTQTIAATNTITADSCGGLKNITAAGAVTTNTTDTFTAPAAANTGCVMMVCNVGTTNTITLDHNAHFFSLAGADVLLVANSCVGVVSDGTQWRQTTAVFTGT